MIGLGKPNSQAPAATIDAEPEIDDRHDRDIGGEIVLDVVGDADEAQLGVAAGEERDHVAAKIHLRRRERRSACTKNSASCATAGVTNAITGVTMLDLRRLDRDGGPRRRHQYLLQLAQRRQRAVEHIELLLDAGADLGRAADPFGDGRGEQA